MTARELPCMGTLFTVVVRDEIEIDAEIDEAFAGLRRVDELFSPYRPESDVSRMRRGELTLADADPLVGEVASLCEQLALETGGRFTAAWNGSFDPTGLVKGFAIERASDLLWAAGSRDHAVNGGGDVQTAGGPWRIGIADPRDRRRLLTVVEGFDFAIATSGTAERGAHIVDPTSGAPATELASVTVLGRSLARVDAYATAALALGRDAHDWLEAQPGHEALVVAADGSPSATSCFFRPRAAA